VRHPTRIRCVEVHPVEHTRCANVYPIGKDGHRGAHNAQGLLWGEPLPKKIPEAPRFKDPGAFLPEAPDPLTRDLAGAEGTMEILALIEREMNSTYDSMVNSRQEDGWFYGFSEAMEILTEVKTKLEEWKK
jgi:hypothetical protein